MSYRTADFFYHLPNELIAQTPVRPRDHSRLLILNKESDKIEHQRFDDIVNYLSPGDVLVLNDSRVFPARLKGRKEKTNGEVEIFLHQEIGADLWECLIGGKVSQGTTILLSKQLKAVVLKVNEDGTRLVKFNLSGARLFSTIKKIGDIPLPPYIKRPGGAKNDKLSYQTVFAAKGKDRSAAAPTAGLHFTKRLLKEVRARGVKIEFITLHVGLGTFSPVKTNDIRKHKMHTETVEISRRTWRNLEEAKARGRRIVAVGTTSCRSLEAAAKLLVDNKIKFAQDGNLRFSTDIFIYPGYRFSLVDALITNFHLPESTLLMLVSALAGRKKILKAYQEAVKKHYRFFSYGDAMLII